MEAICFLELTIHKIFAWFKQNGNIVNSDKSHVLVSLYEEISLGISDSSILSSWSGELLEIAIDSKVTFHEHNTHLCSKANQRLVSWVEFQIKINERKLLNKLHKQALRVIMIVNPVLYHC